MLAMAFVAYQLGAPPASPAITLMLSAWLVLLSWFDLDHFRLPDWLTLPLIACGLIYQYVNDGDLMLAVVGAVSGYAIIWGLAALWRQKRGVDAIGMGDAKLLAAAGAWLGLWALPPVLLAASGTGLIYALGSRILSGKKITMIPFGPFIALGIWSIWLFPALSYSLAN